MFTSNMAIPIGLLLLAADAPVDKTVQEEMKNLQGTWNIVKVIDNRRDDTDTSPKELVFSGDKIKVFFMNARFRIDLAKNPKAMDILDPDGSDATTILPVIYELNGNELRIVIPYGPSNLNADPMAKQTPIRPAIFQQKDVPQTLIIAKRAKQ